MVLVTQNVGLGTCVRDGVDLEVVCQHALQHGVVLVVRVDVHADGDLDSGWWIRYFHNKFHDRFVEFFVK